MREPHSTKQPGRWYERGAEAVQRHWPGVPRVYVCPLCFRGFPPAAHRLLTREDVPPRSVGGRPLLLTCGDCNNRSGHTLDASVAAYEELFDFVDSTMRSPTSGQLVAGNLRVNIAYQADGDTTRIDVLPDGRNNPPGTEAALQAYLQQLAQGDAWKGASVTLSPQHGWRDRATVVGWLRAAYLAVFAFLGYAYADRPDLALVRKQVADPETRLLDGFFITEPQSPAATRALIFVQEPTWLYDCFAVLIGRHIVLLPGPETEPGFFDRLSGQPGQQVSVTGHALSWPREPTFLLDFPPQEAQGNGG